MRHELADYEWAAIKPMLPNKPRGVPRVSDRHAEGRMSQHPAKKQSQRSDPLQPLQGMAAR
jgi:transposase